ncbi:epimerase [Yoonia sp. BS5-3]|uniref:Epimerase n=1 Tax=Yoonia phaeophyticola TaxID=3137369 RepID=A0ABZ2V899_9RHOB
MTKTVLILGGSGKIGSHSADAFWNAGWQVRHYDRKTGDMTQAAMGADVIVNGLNPPAYHDWARTIPAITAQVIAAAKASGAAVILPGNIYNYGDRPGLLDENTPQTAQTRKGQIRIEMEAAYRDAGVPTIVLRAGNFIDPLGNGDIMSMLIMREIAKGRIAAPADPDILLAYAYVPDWARAAVMLADMRGELASFEDIPFPGHAFTITDLHKVLEARSGRKIKVGAFAWWLMRLLSPFWELAREMHEMRYLYHMPHQIGSAKFERLLPGFHATDLETVMLSGLPADIHPDKMMHPGGQTIIAE